MVWKLAIQVGQSSIDTNEANGVGGDQIDGSVAADDRRHSPLMLGARIHK